MSESYILSRKVRKSIRVGIETLEAGKFTEHDLKTLLIDLREIAKYLRPAISDRADFNKMLSDFTEVCDFVAHSSRTYGLVQKAGNVHLKALSSRLELPVDEFTNLPVPSYIDADVFSGIIFVVAGLALKDLSQDRIAASAKKCQDDVALCVMSLLQDSNVRFKDNEGLGVLHLMPYEGKYRIYCQALGSKMEQEAKARTGGAGKVIFGFPVVISSVRCEDPDILGCDFGTDPAPIFETYRDENSILRMRPMLDD